MFYSIRWFETNEENKRVDSECDFLVFDPSFGFLTIEVKGGIGIEIENGRWFLNEYSDRYVQSRRELKCSPYEQAEKSMRHFYNYFADELAEVNIPMIDEMIKCASSDSSYEYQSNIVISHLLTSFKNESINEVGIRNMLHKLTSSLELINKLTTGHPTEEDSKSFFKNAFKFMLLGCGLDTKVVSHKWFPNTRLMDELFSCDYALCNAIKQYILVSNWVL